MQKSLAGIKILINQSAGMRRRQELAHLLLCNVVPTMAPWDREDLLALAEALWPLVHPTLWFDLSLCRDSWPGGDAFDSRIRRCSDAPPRGLDLCMVGMRAACQAAARGCLRCATWLSARNHSYYCDAEMRETAITALKRALRAGNRDGAEWVLATYTLQAGDCSCAAAQTMSGDPVCQTLLVKTWRSDHLFVSRTLQMALKRPVPDAKIIGLIMLLTDLQKDGDGTLWDGVELLARAFSRKSQRVADVVCSYIERKGGESLEDIITRAAELLCAWSLKPMPSVRHRLADCATGLRNALKRRADEQRHLAVRLGTSSSIDDGLARKLCAAGKLAMFKILWRGRTDSSWLDRLASEILYERLTPADKKEKKDELIRSFSIRRWLSKLYPYFVSGIDVGLGAQARMDAWLLIRSAAVRRRIATFILLDSAKAKRRSSDVGDCPSTQTTLDAWMSPEPEAPRKRRRV